MKEDQFRTQYKKAVDTMTTSERMRQRTENKLHELERQGRRPRKAVYVAASLVLAAGIGWAAISIGQQAGGPAAPSFAAGPSNADASSATPASGVVIPKMELPNGSSGVMANMVALVVYKGQIYTQAATSLESADATALRGDKLGRTTSGIDEWSGKDAYIELASNIGEADIYAVKGYDPDFRIMSYTEIDGQVFAELFERTNGMTVNSGADLLGKLRLEGRISAAEWENFDSWNNGLQQFAPLAGANPLDGFLAALQDTKPLAAEPLVDQGIFDDQDRKFLYLKLEDDTRVTLTLFGKGLVRYGNAPVFFEVEPGAFQSLWDHMAP